MARPNWTEAHAVALSHALAQEPYRFGFYSGVRYLERCFPKTPRVGTSIRLSDDAIRLGQTPSLGFAPATLSSFKPGSEDKPPRLEVNFLGVWGPNGPMPLHLTEYARDRIKDHDETIHRFVNVFHHRMLSLFYRSWAAAQPVVNYDRPETDRFATYVGAAFGLGMPSMQHRDAAPDQVKLFFAGHMGVQTNHAQGLRNILAEYFKVRVKIREFVGQWLQLPDNYLSRLGDSPDTGSLGVTTTIGARVWDCQQKFRIVLGPVTFAQFERLLPGGLSLKRLVALVRNYMGDQLAWDLNLILKKEEVPPLQLGQQGRLGWTTWLTSQTPPADVDDLKLDPAVEIVAPAARETE